jgi:uncharacterized repeat protein (TIGR03803 family)
VYVACELGDASHFDGGVDKFAQLANWNGDGSVTGTVVHTFGYFDGAYPTCLAVSGNTLFGATLSGGNNGAGALDIFSINPTTISLQQTFSLISSNGTDPSAMTVGPDRSLFLTCESGGTGYGIVFLYPYVVNQNGYETGFETHNFNGSDGNTPIGSLQVGSSVIPRVVQKASLKTDSIKANGIMPNDNVITNYTLYGVTLFGGTNGNGPGTTGYGTVYSINNDGSGFQTLHVFSAAGSISTNGYGPHGGMVLSGNTLYGTTSGGGKFGSGTIFKIDTTGSNFMVLKSFSAYGFDSANNITNGDGEAPEGDLVLSGDTLYGTTLGGGTNGGGGVVWSMNTNGGNFTVLHSFSTPTDNGTGTGTYTNAGGGGTSAGLLLSGHTLFGTTPSGGIYGGGTLFAIFLPSPPLLNLAQAGGNFTVSWPSAATNFMLQKNLTLNSLTWSNFSGAVNDDGTNKSISILPAAGGAFFRLLSTNGL